MREIDEREYKYLGVVEMDKIKDTDMKKFASGRWSWLSNPNWMVGIKYQQFTCGLYQYLNLRQVSWNGIWVNWKCMTMHGTFRHKTGRDRLFLTRKKEGQDW